MCENDTIDKAQINDNFIGNVLIILLNQYLKQREILSENHVKR
jgi:hypothetical protein